jgi:hypothetical protein
MLLCTIEQYTYIHFVYRLCDGNVTASVQEYERWFPNQWTPDWRVFSLMHRYLWGKGEFPKPMTENSVQQIVDKEEIMLEMVDSSLSPMFIECLGEPMCHAWGIGELLTITGVICFTSRLFKPFSLRITLRVWNSVTGSFEMISSFFIFVYKWGDVYDRWNNKPQKFPLMSLGESKWNKWDSLSTQIFCKCLCGIIDRLIGPFIFEHRLTAEIYLNFLEDNLPELLEDALL